MPHSIPAASILVVDDTDSTRRWMSRMLAEEADILTASSGEEAIRIARDREPALVLLDIEMPGMDGFEACRQLKQLATQLPIHIMLVSALATAEHRVEGYAAGADDFLAKPFDAQELRSKVCVHLRLRRALAERETVHQFSERAAGHLSNVVDEQARGLIIARQMTAQALASLAESRDPETGHHLERMRDYAVAIVDQLRLEGPYANQIDECFAEMLLHAAPLHDVGKVGVPDAVLKKPGRLDQDEFLVMQQHTVIGANVLEAIHDAESNAGTTDDRSFMPMAVEIARSHHERWDGSGYPDGRSGTDIPLAARIVAVADVFDALTSARVYKPAFPSETARSVIRKGRSRHFDPVVADAFEAAWDRIIDIHELFSTIPPVAADVIVADVLVDDDDPTIPLGVVLDQEGSAAVVAEFGQRSNGPSPTDNDSTDRRAA
ncbi:MAG: HD domain-containing phosphohydrolase [Phycisphaerales bacterium]